MFNPLILGLSGLCALSSATAEATPVAFVVHSGHFERNDSGLAGPSSTLLIEDRPSFDKVFGVAFTMGPRPDVVPEDAFATRVVVAVIKRGAEVWEYTVQGVTEEGGVLTVRYTATSEEGDGGARFASPLIVSVPGGTFHQVVFLEDGKEVGKAGRRPPADEARVLFDFGKPDAARAWQPVNDGVMGGVSEGRFRITDQGTMEFLGTLSLENNGGFASVRSRRAGLGLKPDDILVLRLRGDGREYLLNLYVPTLRMASSYRAAIPTKAGEWTEVRIPLADCYATSFGNKVPNAGPVDAPRVDSIGFMLSDKKPGPFTLEIAWVKVAGGKGAN
jgi:monofunctional biosynthetic peptidoglycan transglycosylase